ncbi:MAG: tetratricopeptide repeat protein [Elusimicrobiota bacterium]
MADRFFLVVPAAVLCAILCSPAWAQIEMPSLSPAAELALDPIAEPVLEAAETAAFADELPEPAAEDLLAEEPADAAAEDEEPAEEEPQEVAEAEAPAEEPSEQEAPAEEVAPPPAAESSDPKAHAREKLAFLERSFASASKDVLGSLLEQVEEMIRGDRESEVADGAHDLKALIHEKRKEYASSIVGMLKLIYEYPDSKLAFNTKRRLLEMVGKRMKTHRARLSELARGPEPGLDRPARFAALLRELALVEEKDLYAPLTGEFREFLGRYPAHRLSGEMTHLLAQLHARKGENEIALLIFEETLALFKDPVLLAKTQFALAEHLVGALKRYDKAAEAYQKVIAAYPADELAREAHVKLGELLYRRLKQPALAIEILQKAVTRYPAADAAYAALLLQAEIHADQKSLAKAVAALEALAAMFPGEKAVGALKKAADLADSGKDYAEQVRLLSKLAADNPKSKEAPEALYEAAQICEKRLADAAKAEELYKRVVDEYASSKLAAKARKRLAP